MNKAPVCKRLPLLFYVDFTLINLQALSKCNNEVLHMVILDVKISLHWTKIFTVLISK